MSDANDNQPLRPRFPVNIPIIGQKKPEEEMEQLRIGCAVDTEHKRVVLMFGRQIAQVGFDARSARMVGLKLMQAAEQLENPQPEAPAE